MVGLNMGFWCGFVSLVWSACCHSVWRSLAGTPIFSTHHLYIVWWSSEGQDLWILGICCRSWYFHGRPVGPSPQWMKALSCWFGVGFTFGNSTESSSFCFYSILTSPYTESLAVDHQSPCGSWNLEWSSLPSTWTSPTQNHFPSYLPAFRIRLYPHKVRSSDGHLKYLRLYQFGFPASKSSARSSWCF